MSEPPSPIRPVPWHRRLEARVLACVCLLAGLSIAAVLVATKRVVTAHLLDRAETDLEATRQGFLRLIDDRATFAAAESRLVTALPVFRAHMTDARVSADAATIQEMAETYRRELRADFCVVTDARGQWMGRPGWPASAPPADLDGAVRAALAGRSHRAIAAVAGRIFLVVSEPGRFGDEVIGTFTSGYELADRFAAALARSTSSQVSFVAGGRLVGSSLDVAEKGELDRAVAERRGPFGEPSTRPALARLGEDLWVGATYPLPAAEGAATPGQLILLRPWRPTRQLLDAVGRALLGLGAAAFVLSVSAALVFSRRVTRPLQEIAAAAAEIAGGDWSRRLPVRGCAEAGSMAAALNDMTASLKHWNEEARAKSERLEEALELLQAAYRRFEAVAQSANDAIVSADETGAVLLWNRRAETMFGYAEAEARGMPFDLVLAAGHRAELRRRVADLTSAATGAVTGATREMRGLRRDGTEFPAELSLAAWRAGEATNFTAIVRDVTERKEAEQALWSSTEQLRQAQKMEAIGRLAGGVAHDFNNILTVIGSYSELTLLRQLEPASRAAIEEIQKAGDRAAALTRQLLAFSRKQVLTPRVLRLDEIAAGMESMLRRLIGEDIEILGATDPDLGAVRADPGQIEQVILNLAVNARDAMPRGGRLVIETRNVTLDAVRAATLPGARPGEFVMLGVSDTGSGMEPAVLSRVFEPFFTTKEVDKGTGLGLSTVYGIVQQTGGFIAVESQPGHGSTFHVYLPRAAAEREDGEVDDEQTKAVAAAPREGATVVVAEDEPAVRTLVCDVLRARGHLVLAAACGEEALARAAAHAGAIDLLIADVVMPGISGRVLAEELTRRRPGMKVLFMSGYTDDAVVAHGIQRGMPFLEKPFTPERLAAAIGELLGAAAAAH